MALASASLAIPTAFSASISQSNENYASSILVLSRGTAHVLLIVYVMYLFFQLRTHTDLFEEEPTAAPSERLRDTQELQTLGPIAASLIIIIFSMVVAICATFLIGSIEPIVETSQMSKRFFGLILIPIISNVAEYSTTCMAAWRDKMDLVISLAIGNSMQIALFVMPFLVILGWAIGQPMTFNFSDFEVMMLLVSVFVVAYLIQDGKSNYLEGLMCLGV
jgi:Ca2+:H+ antiporter